MTQIAIYGFGIFIAVLGIALFMGMDMGSSLVSSTIGSLGYIIYCILLIEGKTAYIALFISSFLVTIISHVFARSFKQPTTIYTILGNFPLVPGATIYDSVLKVLAGEDAEARLLVSQGIGMAIGISLGIVAADTLAIIYKEIHRRIEKNKEGL